MSVPNSTMDFFLGGGEDLRDSLGELAGTFFGGGGGGIVLRESGRSSEDYGSADGIFFSFFSEMQPVHSRS